MNAALASWFKFADPLKYKIITFSGSGLARPRILLISQSTLQCFDPRGCEPLMKTMLSLCMRSFGIKSQRVNNIQPFFLLCNCFSVNYFVHILRGFDGELKQQIVAIVGVVDTWPAQVIMSAYLVSLFPWINCLLIFYPRSQLWESMSAAWAVPLMAWPRVAFSQANKRVVRKSRGGLAMPENSQPWGSRALAPTRDQRENHITSSQKIITNK